MILKVNEKIQSIIFIVFLLKHSDDMFDQNEYKDHTSDHGPANHLAGHFSLGTKQSLVSLYFSSALQRSSSTAATVTPSKRPQNTRRV